MKLSDQKLAEMVEQLEADEGLVVAAFDAQAKFSDDLATELCFLLQAIESLNALRLRRKIASGVLRDREWNSVTDIPA